MDSTCMGIGLPDGCEHYIKQHRTRLNVVSDPKDEYILDTWDDYLSIQEYLPESINSVLDIGCGLGLLDVFLFKIHAKPTINLLDGTGDEGNNKFMYYDKCDIYNDMKMTIRMMECNGVDSFSLYNPYYNGKIESDVIISLYSWCFHYPVNTYLELVSKSLVKDGIMIVEVKRGNGDREILEKEFDLIDVVQENKHSDRCIFGKR